MLTELLIRLLTQVYVANLASNFEISTFIFIHIHWHRKWRMDLRVRQLYLNEIWLKIIKNYVLITHREIKQDQGLIFDNYALVTLTMNLRRRTFYFVFNFVFPCFIIAILCTMGFVLPAGSGEKVVLGKFKKKILTVKF